MQVAALVLTSLLTCVQIRVEVGLADWAAGMLGIRQAPRPIAIPKRFRRRRRVA